MKIYTFDETPGRIAYLNKEAYLFFSGYSYLGMQYVPAFAALVKEGIDKYGWLSPSSRISNTRLKIFEEAEALLSAITGMEDTVLVSSGYTAGRIATAPFAGDLLNLDPSHPAIKRSNNSGSNIYAVDSVETINASITDFSFADNDDKEKLIIIDDSHGIGLIGEHGEGIKGRLHQNEHVQYILTYSLSKAFNIHAGAVSCSKEMAKQYRTQYAYTAATAPSPGLLHAFLKGQDIYSMQRAKLRNNTAYFYSLIKDIYGIHHHSELPVFILPENINEQKLYAQKIVISSFAYPDENGKKCNRIVLSALHTKEDLEKLALCLRQVI